jgi:hypothetical protein
MATDDDTKIPPQHNLCRREHAQARKCGVRRFPKTNR